MPFLFIIVFLINFLAACQNQKGERISFEPSKKDPTPSVSSHKFSTKATRSDFIQTDGAPKNPKPILAPSPKPVSEPMSRYGNPGVYQVKDHTYEVMKTASGYRERGVASWYGTKFHAKRTSSGEPYNLYALTAAHKTLPLPTYVKVTNLSNGREIVVKVNDRGPFHNDRIIDLSYGAAVKLGLLPKGTAPVEIEALSTNRLKSNEAHYYLQAGAFSSEKYAQALLLKLKKLTSSPIFIEQYKEFFIVKAGPFANKELTDELKKLLAENGVIGSFSMMQ